MFDLDPRQLLRDRAPAARHRRIAVRAARSQAAPIFSSAAPTIRSIRRPAGSPRACKPKSTPARNSCRRSSAWMPAWCAATWRGWPSTASPDKISLHHRHRAAALGQIGALDQGKTVRRHHPRRADRAHGSARAIPLAEGRRICLDLVQQLSEHPACRRRAHHGAGQRRRRAGHHCAARDSIKRLASA